MLGKADYQILRQNHKFLRDEENEPETVEEFLQGEKITKENYGKILAMKYYEKLYKQYVLVDLRFYEEGRVGCRWRTAGEVKRGKGERVCGNLGCEAGGRLLVFEMNFGYVEEGEKKNALVKVSVCRECEKKLNFKVFLVFEGLG